MRGRPGGGGADQPGGEAAGGGRSLRSRVPRAWRCRGGSRRRRSRRGGRRAGRGGRAAARGRGPWSRACSGPMPPAAQISTIAASGAAQGIAVSPPGAASRGGGCGADHGAVGDGVAAGGQGGVEGLVAGAENEERALAPAAHRGFGGGDVAGRAVEAWRPAVRLPPLPRRSVQGPRRRDLGRGPGGEQRRAPGRGGVRRHRRGGRSRRSCRRPPAWRRPRGRGGRCGTRTAAAKASALSCGAEADMAGVGVGDGGGGVVGGAVDHREADARGGQRGFGEADAVGEAEPGPEHAAVLRLGEAGADAEAHALDAEFVPVEAGEVLGEGLGQAVEGVGALRDAGVGHRLDRMEADGVDRAGIDHAAGAVAAGALVDVVGGGQGVGEDLLEALLAGVAGEMQDGVAVAGDLQRGGLVGEVALHDLLVRAGRAEVGDVGEAQGLGEMAEAGAQVGAEAAGGAGDQDAAIVGHRRHP